MYHTTTHTNHRETANARPVKDGMKRQREAISSEWIEKWNKWTVRKSIPKNESKWMKRIAKKREIQNEMTVLWGIHTNRRCGSKSTRITRIFKIVSIEYSFFGGCSSIYCSAVVGIHGKRICSFRVEMKKKLSTDCRVPFLSLFSSPFSFGFSCQANRDRDRVHKLCGHTNTRTHQ